MKTEHRFRCRANVIRLENAERYRTRRQAVAIDNHAVAALRGCHELMDVGNNEPAVIVIKMDNPRARRNRQQGNQARYNDAHYFLPHPYG
jgi:hypothetical protein